MTKTAKMTMRWLVQSIVVAAAMFSYPEQSQASIDPPWGFPDCGPINVPGVSGAIPKPYVWDRNQYLGIFLAVEPLYGPRAKEMFPLLIFEEHRNWVRISRDAKHPVQVPGEENGTRSTAFALLSMRIDKCDGAISEMKFINLH